MSGAIVAAGLFAAVALALVSDSGTCDVQVADSSENEDCVLGPGGALVDYIGSDSDTSSSGTGTFDPFVRLQGSPTENGYNTDGAVAFDTKSGKWTHAIKVGAIPIVTVGGVDYWELFVDINDANNATHISLNEVEVWFTTNPDLIGYDDPTGFPASSGAVQVYDFSGDILINDVNQGSGRGDLRYLIPITGISWTAADYFVLYSEWGTTADIGSISYISDGGFEEWKVRKVPPPPSLILDKVVIRDNGGTAAESLWTLTATGALATATNLSGPGAAGSADVVSGPSFKADTYTLAESGSVAGYTNGTTYSCVTTPAGGVAGAPVVSNTITLASGDSAICTITNNDNPPSLTLDKVVVSDNGGTAAESDWNLTATGALAIPTNLSGAGAAGSADVVSGASFKADTYTLAETGTVSGYTNGTTYSCVTTPAGGVAGAPVVSNSITLNNGDSAVCTITNTDDKASPAIKTAQGWALFDTANFTGIRAGALDAASATVTFKLWSTNTAGVCSGLLGTRTESLSGNSATTSTGIVVTPTTSPTTFYWTAEYSGDQFNNSATSACGTETTTISWVQPAP
jgi:hypothetical protein